MKGSRERGGAGWGCSLSGVSAVTLKQGVRKAQVGGQLTGIWGLRFILGDMESHRVLSIAETDAGEADQLSGNGHRRGPAGSGPDSTGGAWWWFGPGWL